jgi:hypothetical protein
MLLSTLSVILERHPNFNGILFYSLDFGIVGALEIFG